MTAGMAHLERAYAAFRHRPDPVSATVCALRLAFHHYGHFANPTVAHGWIARASRLVDEQQLDVLQGELLLVRAYVTDDAVAAEVWAREALARGKAMRDVDLELCSLSQLGASLKPGSRPWRWSASKETP